MSLFDKKKLQDSLNSIPKFLAITLCILYWFGWIPDNIKIYHTELYTHGVLSFPQRVLHSQKDIRTNK